jgi:phospholipid/cholesterol/gamma-HCH transport system substrate-binding protein
MNNRMQAIRVGLFFLLGLALLWVTAQSLSGGRIFKEKGYSLVARFDNLKGLQKGDDVLMAGVRIGSVAQVRLVDRQAEAVLTIDPLSQIATDAVAMVAQSSLLGTNHLEVTVGSPTAAKLPPGSEIRTRNTTDMNEVIAKLGSLGERLEQVVTEIGKNLGGGESGSLFTKIDRLVAENGPKLTETVANLQDITAKIRHGEGTIGHLINDTQLHDQLLASVDEIKHAVTDARAVIASAQAFTDQVRSGKGTLGTLLYDDQTAGQIRVAVKNLREVSDKLNSGQGTLGRLMSDDSLFLDAQSTLRKVDRAADGLSDQGPITAVGVAYKSLF